MLIFVFRLSEIKLNIGQLLMSLEVLQLLVMGMEFMRLGGAQIGLFVKMVTPR